MEEIYQSFVQGYNSLLDLITGFPTLGWLLLGLGLIWFGIYLLYRWYITDEFFMGINWVILAVDVPLESEKTPQVMEQVLAGLHGTHTNPNFIDKYWKGKQQEAISLEIIGIGGHVKYLIRCADYHRELVEAHFYAQYPDAELYEVEDYASALPDNLMASGKYDMFGSELELVKEDAYPIRTYVDFEDPVNKEMIDPLANVIEVLSHLNPGEQIWLQMVVKPALDTKWVEDGMKVVGELIHEKKDELPPSIISKGGEFLTDAILKGAWSAMGAEVLDDRKDDSFEPQSLKQFLPQGTLDVVDAIQRSIAKTAFQTKIRMVYIADKEVFFKPRFSSIMGAIKQYNSANLNSLKPNSSTITKINYFFREARERKRKIRLLRMCRSWGDFSKGAPVFVFNTEELATLFHFPNIGVVTPGLVRSEYKKGGAPANLPVVVEE